MRKIRKGDKVIVTKGKDRGRSGVVLSVVSEGFRIIIEGINVVKKNIKPNPSKGEQGGIIEKEASISISNVAIWNEASGKADRIGFKFLENGNKVRIFKSTGELVDIT